MSKKRIALLGFVALAILQAAPGFGAKPGDPKAQFKGFSEFASKIMAEWKVPGMAVAVVKDGQVILAEGFGLRDIADGLKVTPQTLFAIGSATKAFTAVTMGILVDEGKVEWDTPVSQYLPTFKLQDDFATTHMTPRDLLCHRSGLPRHDMIWYGTTLSRQELFDRLAQLEPSREFRSFWQYQNLMFMTAGHLVGTVSGSTWEEFTRRRIFEPLGMTGSDFSVEDMKAVADRALPYGERRGQVTELPYRSADAMGPAGSINSNVIDMAKWVMLNLNKGRFGGMTVVSEAAMREIQNPQMVIKDTFFNVLHDFPELSSPSYGMGWFITSYRGHTLLHHGGGIDGFTAMVSIMPREKTGLIILTNLEGRFVPFTVMFNIYDRLLGLDQVAWDQRFKELDTRQKADAEKARQGVLKDRRPDTKPSHPLDDYAGEYVHPAYGTLSITNEGSSLRATHYKRQFVLSHFHYDDFELNDVQNPDAPALRGTFGMDIEGNIMTLTVPFEPAVKGIVFTRGAGKELTERSFLEKMCGPYELMGQTITVELKGDRTLVLMAPGQPPLELVPYKGTQFNIKGVTGVSVEFKLDSSGSATGLVLSQPNGTFTAKKK
jgi:CubicO group peptidase (beta-lactamase class C family)